MKNTLIIFLLFSFLVNSYAQETKWEIDYDHSNVSFEISYFKLSKIKGTYQKFSGVFKSDKENFENASVTVTIDATSIDTNQDARDKHLQAPEFFDTKKYPEIKFESTKFKKQKENSYVIVGNLTMRGITKQVELQGNYQGSFFHPRFKKTIGIFQISGDIPRDEFEVATNYPPAAIALGKKVKLIAEIQIGTADTITQK